MTLLGFPFFNELETMTLLDMTISSYRDDQTWVFCPQYDWWRTTEDGDQRDAQRLEPFDVVSTSCACPLYPLSSDMCGY